ncbi:MAG TPA: TetR/AcrR family transcriptional regulator [Steroidobacteraceae bacterium]
MVAVPTELRIRRAALRLLEKEGAEAVTMRRLARAIGITPMAIYHHFPTREALLRAVVDREFGEFLGELGKVPTADTAEEQIVHALDAYVEYALSRPQIFDYVFSNPREDARRYPEDFRARLSPTLNPLADAVAKLMDEGALLRDDIWEVTLELWAHAHGYVALYRASRFSLAPKDFKELLHRSMRRLFRGLEARDAHGSVASAALARESTTVLSEP